MHQYLKFCFFLIGVCPYSLADLGFRAAFSHRLSQDSSTHTHFRFQPEVKRGLIRAEATLEKPLNEYEGWRLPAAGLSLAKTYNRFEPYVSLWMMNVDRWALDGNQVRPAIGLRYRSPLSQQVEARADLRIFHQWNQFTQSASGESIPGLGFRELIESRVSWGPLQFLSGLALQQYQSGSWKNEIGLEIGIAHSLSDKWEWGLSYTWLFHRTDPVSGEFQTVRLFDTESSALTAHFEVQL